VTEYHSKLKHQSVPIIISIEVYTGAELEKLVKELAWSYRQLYLPDAQRSELTSDQDYAKYLRESDLAWSALHAAFKHHENFSVEFLQDLSDGAALRINEQLMRWAHEIKWPGYESKRPLSDSWLSHTAMSSQECCEKTRAFMEDGLWPFTKIMR
jgi:hypothetical protein